MSTRIDRIRATQMTINDAITRHFSNAHTLRGSPETQIKLAQLNAYNEVYHDVLKTRTAQLTKLYSGELYWLGPKQRKSLEKRILTKLEETIEDIEELGTWIAEIENEAEMEKVYRTASARHKSRQASIRTRRNRLTGIPE